MSYNLLKGKRGIIFGALDSKSIAWKVAERAHEEGAKFVLTNAPVALRLGTISELAEKEYQNKEYSQAINYFKLCSNVNGIYKSYIALADMEVY